MIFVEFINFFQKFRRYFWSKNPMFIKKCRHKNEKKFNFFDFEDKYRVKLSV